MDFLRALVERNIADGIFVPHTSFCDTEIPEGVEDGASRPRQDEQPVTLIAHDDR